jgi:hypothetical protein
MMRVSAGASMVEMKMVRELRRPPARAAEAATSRWREVDERFATLTAPISVKEIIYGLLKKRM